MPRGTKGDFTLMVLIAAILFTDPKHIHIFNIHFYSTAFNMLTLMLTQCVCLADEVEHDRVEPMKVKTKIPD